MPWLNVTLTWLMPSAAVGPVGVGLEAEAAQLVVRERNAAELLLWSSVTKPRPVSSRFSSRVRITG